MPYHLPHGRVTYQRTRWVYTDTARKPLRCRLGWHTWVPARTAAGWRYAVCPRCGGRAATALAHDVDRNPAHALDVTWLTNGEAHV